MIRIIDRTRIDGKLGIKPNVNDLTAYIGRKGETFTVRAHELGNGHVEMSAVRDTEWTELDWSPMVMQDHLDWMAAQKVDPELLAEQAIKRIRIAANRAKTKVRRLCKAMGADTLLTLTYRFNELDLARVKLDLKEFNRRMCRELPMFRFVAAFEQQKRGAWHVHMATAGIPVTFTRRNASGLPIKVKSFDVIRAIWRGVTKERGGNIDISRRKRHSRSTPALIAAYISKYMLKDFEKMAAGINRYAAYGDFNIPAPVNLGRVSTALEALEVCYSCLGERLVFSQHLSRWNDWFFLHGEIKPVTSSPH